MSLAGKISLFKMVYNFKDGEETVLNDTKTMVNFSIPPNVKENKLSKSTQLVVYNSDTDSIEFNSEYLVVSHIKSRDIIVAIKGIELDDEIYSIDIIDVNTLKIIESNEINAYNSSNRTFQSFFITEKPFVGVSISYDMYNIHGERLNIDTSSMLLRDSTFIDKGVTNIYKYDNLVDMRLLNVTNLDTLNGKIQYYPIMNPSNARSNKKQVIFIHFNESDRLYAYDLDDKNIHIVRDNRVKFNKEQVLSIIKDIPINGDIEKRQYEYDIKHINDANYTRLGLYKASSSKYKNIVSFTSIKDLVNEYQHEFSGFTYKFNTSLENRVKSYSKSRDLRLDNRLFRMMTAGLNSGYLLTTRHSCTNNYDNLLINYPTDYLENSLNAVNMFKHDIQKEGCNRVDILDTIISTKELKRLEGI